MKRGFVSGCAVIAALTGGGVAGSAAADLLAGWNFNGLDAPVGASISAQHGSGSLDLSDFTTGLAWQPGSSLNAWGSGPAGEGLGFTGTSLNGKSAVFTTSSAGYEGLSLSMAVRATATGHMLSVIEAWNGADWQSVGSFSLVGSVWTTASFDLSGLGFLNDGVASLRLRLDGATSAQGNFRVDNVRIEATAIPAPAALALLGCAGLCGRRRRE